MAEHPRVTVIIPNYNHARFLKQRIDSVLAQSYTDFELILLDDRSTDESWGLLQSYGSHPSVYMVEQNETNSGSPFGLWARGLELARGALIWIAESDDWCDPEFLETLVPAFDDPKVVISHCRSYNTVGQKRALNTWWNDFGEKHWENDYVRDGLELLNFYGKYRCPVMNVSSALVRKASFTSELIPVDFKYSGDWWFWVQMFTRGRVSFSATPLNFIRIHNESVIRKKGFSALPRLTENAQVIRLIYELLEDTPVYSERYDWLLDDCVAQMVNSGNRFNWNYLNLDLPVSFKKELRKRYWKRLVNDMVGKFHANKKAK